MKVFVVTKTFGINEFVSNGVLGARLTKEDADALIVSDKINRLNNICDFVNYNIEEYEIPE